MTFDVILWTQSGVKSQKINISHNFFCIELKVPYVHCDISMATQWAPGPLHSKGKTRVFLLQEVLFVFVVHSVVVNEYGHYTAQAQESLLNWSNK